MVTDTAHEAVRQDEDEDVGVGGRVEKVRVGNLGMGRAEREGKREREIRRPEVKEIKEEIKSEIWGPEGGV